MRFLCRVGFHRWGKWQPEKGTVSDWWRVCRQCHQVQQVVGAIPVGKREVSDDQR